MAMVSRKNRQWSFASRSVITLLWVWSLSASPSVWAFPVDVAQAPDSSLALTVKAIRSAKRSLAINIYEFTSDDVKKAVIDQIRKGVEVQILEEGQPVGGFPKGAQAIQKEIADAMSESNKQNRFFVITSKVNQVHRRFRFNHGKYIIVDQKSVLVGSENYSPTGQPMNGNKGNRGWEALVHSSALADQFLETFSEDTQSEGEDVVDVQEFMDYMNQRGTLFGPLLYLFGFGIEGFAQPSVTVLSQLQSSWVDLGLWPFSAPLHSDFSQEPLKNGSQEGPGVGDLEEETPPAMLHTGSPMIMEAYEAHKVTSPDSSLSGLLDLVNSARKTIDLELMTLDACWGGCQQQSPLFEAVIDAAKRGVKVRVLLNDERVFSASAKLKNHYTVRLLTETAEQEGLPITAAIANLKAMDIKIIHNKGALVDGTRTLISSINWNQNSVMNNREAAIILDSPEIGRHYGALFDSDWKLTMKNPVKLGPNPSFLSELVPALD